ncbi:MAG: hypothetical protein CMN77_12180 [Spirochaetaceae bacterium]|nr:hypothetical protein [Spirochaetaceae bacterium]|tara:strand:- start:142 stop:837 length:696 start_codon:yes stop_codon:yes gene_type:complete
MIHRSLFILFGSIFIWAAPAILSREIESLHPDPVEVHRRRVLEYSLKDCFQLRQELRRLIESETSSSEWISFSVEDFTFLFGPGGQLEIGSDYNHRVLPPMKGSWTLRNDSILLKARYRQFLIGPCMATCMAGFGYIYPERLEPNSYAKWGLNKPLGISNSCKMHCFKEILETYGKTLVDFDLELEMTTMGPSQPSILIHPIQYSDPEPVVVKKSYVLDSFSRPMKLRCEE